MGILDFLRSSSAKPGILERTAIDFSDMIANCHWMYRRAATALWESSDIAETKREIYDRDILVNKAQRAIRKSIVEHLAINPRSETNYCLVLMSVVKDAERVGDYCKNLMDLTDYHPTWKDDNALVPEFKKIQAEIEAMFAKVDTAFRKADTVVGAELVREERDATRACDRLIEKILGTEGMTVRHAVTYTLLARFYKRIAAHLGNIASSLVMPLHKLDYFDEEYLPGREGRAGDDR